MLKRWRGPFSDSTFWSTNLIILIATVFLERFGQGIVNAVNTNFFVDALGLSGTQVLWLTGFREIPGLSLMFVAALVMHLPLVRRATLSLVLMGVGYGLYVFVGSYTAVVAVAIIASLGFHNWSPVEQALGMGLAPKGRSGEVLGTITSVASLAAIAGMGVVALLAFALPLRAFYAVGEPERGHFYANQLDFLLRDIDIHGVRTRSLPYTLNRQGGYDWVDPAKGFVSTAAWYVFAKNRFNPLTLRRED